jgi:hypothetical protein
MVFDNSVDEVLKDVFLEIEERSQDKKQQRGGSWQFSQERLLFMEKREV